MVKPLLMNMKISLSSIFLICVASFYISCQSNQAAATSYEEDSPENMEEKAQLLRHVVIFKFKDDASQADVDKVHAAFKNLPNELDVIKDFEWGLNDSPEDLHQGFTHCYMLSFESEEDRDSIYAPSPQHQAFVAGLQPHLEKAFVVDYWAYPASE